MSEENPHGSGSVAPGDTSKRVGMEVIRERGVDPEELREKLIDAIGAEFTTYYYAHVKHVVGESEHGSDDFCERFSTWFAEDTSPELESSQIRRQLVF